MIVFFAVPLRKKVTLSILSFVSGGNTKTQGEEGNGLLVILNFPPLSSWVVWLLFCALYTVSARYRVAF